MKARYSYPLLFLLPSAMLAAVAGVVLTAAAAGVAWVFVFGDDPWPESARTMIMVVGVVAFVAALTTLLSLSYSFGRRQESAGGLCRSHVWAALALSIGIPLLVLLHQWQVGNVGNTSAPANNSSKPTPLRGAA